MISSAYRQSPRVAEGVGDRIAAVAAEIARAELDPGRGLPALVFGDIEQLFDALDRGRVVAFGYDLLEGHFLLDQAFENAVEHGIGRKRVLVLLVRTQLSGRRLLDHALGHDAAR